MKYIDGFYNNDEIDIEKIIPVYQNAFAEEPWFEKGKCNQLDCPQRKECCPTGFSKHPKGEICPMGKEIIEEAYTPEELKSTLRKNENSLWYLEFEDEQLALSALAWQCDTFSVTQKKYPNQPEMLDWLDSKLNNNAVWLDEVFRDKNVRETGNLARFGKMVCGILERFNSNQLVYRTITEAMIKKPQKIFPSETTIYQRGTDVPDNRDFVIINLMQKVQDEC